jgi:Xaa-Pro aminopeptidase
MFEQRQQKLFRLMKERGIESLLLTSPFNVTYLTGFTGEDSYLFVRKNSVQIWSDARYEEQIGEECPGVDLLVRKPTEGLMDAAGRWLEKIKVSALHVESARRRSLILRSSQHT